MKEQDNIEITCVEEKPEANSPQSSELNNMRLSCPLCDLIPALFFDIKSKNIYKISAACENKHLMNNIPVKEFYDKYMKIKDTSKDTLKDFICQKHNSNYMSFCKSCQKNICKECSDTEHSNHFISQYYESLPSNEDIIQLKNSIDKETNDVEEFLSKTYKKWLEEIQQKFNELIESIRYKNKLYNYIINFYETKEFNYQNIHNIKIVSQNQIKRNQLTEEIQTLKNLISRMEAATTDKKLSKYELQENKNKYLKLNTAQILKILNLTNSDINSNYQFKPFDSNNIGEDQSLENYLYEKNNNIANELNEFKIINPYNKSKTLSIDNDNLKNSLNLMKSYSNEKIEEKKLDEKMQFANEVKLNRKKLAQSIPQESIVHCLTLLKDNEGKYNNKFATGLEDGKINVYYYDKKRNKIYLDFEIKEHTKAVEKEVVYYHVPWIIL